MAAKINNILLLYTDKYYLIKPVYPFGLDLIARHLQREGYNATIGYPFLPHTDPETNLKALLQRTQPDLIGLGLRNLDTTMSCEPYGNYKGREYQAFFFLPDIRDIVTTIKTLYPRLPLIAGGGGFEHLSRVGFQEEAFLLQLTHRLGDAGQVDLAGRVAFED